MVELIFFWLPVFLLFHSYVLFPLILYVWKRKRLNNELVYQESDSLPTISVLIALYNEENTVDHRVRNVFLSNYPAEKLEVIVGSDGSTDRTNAILQELQIQYPALKVSLFSERRGKGNVLNDLVIQAKGEILLLTDAKVMFSPQAAFQLVKHFLNPKVGVVGGNLINSAGRKDGISIQESLFMSREIMIKYNEGRLWGTMIGAYGACYAIRRELFEKIPEGFAVEDFYITLRALEKGYKAIMELNAVCYEDVPNKLKDEFRRKVRISSGNFQNLKAFSHLIFNWNMLSFCFISHKVIRWLGPFLLISVLLSNIILFKRSDFYTETLILQAILLVIPLIDFFLRKIHIHIITLRFITHFYSMNLALLLGFIKYLKGIKTNVWEPTERSFR